MGTGPLSVGLEDEGVKASELLLKEIDIIREEIDRYDNNGLTIKGWSLAVWAGTIAYGVEHSQWVIVLVSLVAPASFAVVELAYRRFQQRFIARSKRIEEMLLASRRLENYQFEVHRSAIGLLNDSSFRNEGWTAIQQPQFWIFYSLLALASVGATVYVWVNPAS
jgi:hypothetical protein